MNTRRAFLKKCFAFSATSLLSSTLLSCAEKKNSRPNVILIITDDQGYGDFGVAGNPVIRTPNMDVLAKKSGQMTNYYVQPVCAPTRSCLMTGRYNYRTRCIDTFVGRAMMETEEITLAELLKDSGYATGIFGKWHLGDSYPLRPQEQGFEEVLVHRGGGIGQPSDPPGGEGKYTDPILFHNGQQVQEKGYCTDIYFNRALEWIEKTHKKNRNFFAYIPTNAPHSPFHDVPEGLYQEYKNVNLNNDQFPQKVGHKLVKKQDTDRLARIYAMITNIDENIGKLFEKLEKIGVLENTLLVFMVDNGPNGRRYVAGYKGMKATVYEGGTHSPLYMYWPKHIKAGTSSDRVVAHIDILPTVLEACNLPKPQNVKLDGRSFLPLLTTGITTWQDRYIVIQSHRGNEPVLYHNFSIRNQKWKLVHASGFNTENFAGEPNFELFNMENDPYETTNLAQERPDKLNELKAAYEEWFKDVSHTRPDNYAPPRIYIGTPYENPVTLTRQDWRHAKGRPWADNSNGFWMLYAANDGIYDFKVRMRNVKADGKIILKVGDNSVIKSIKRDQERISFEAIDIKKGNIDIMVTLKFTSDSKGPWQVDVIKKS